MLLLFSSSGAKPESVRLNTELFPVTDVGNVHLKVY